MSFIHEVTYSLLYKVVIDPISAVVTLYNRPEDNANRLYIACMSALSDYLIDIRGYGNIRSNSWAHTVRHKAVHCCDSGFLDVGHIHLQLPDNSTRSVVNFFNAILDFESDLEETNRAISRYGHTLESRVRYLPNSDVNQIGHQYHLFMHKNYAWFLTLGKSALMAFLPYMIERIGIRICQRMNLKSVWATRTAYAAQFFLMCYLASDMPIAPMLTISLSSIVISSLAKEFGGAIHYFSLFVNAIQFTLSLSNTPHTSTVTGNITTLTASLLTGALTFWGTKAAVNTVEKLIGISEPRPAAP